MSDAASIFFSVRRVGFSGNFWPELHGTPCIYYQRQANVPLPRIVGASSFEAFVWTMQISDISSTNQSNFIKDVLIKKRDRNLDINRKWFFFFEFKIMLQQVNFAKIGFLAIHVFWLSYLKSYTWIENYETTYVFMVSKCCGSILIVQLFCVK